jgi:hypothetical protein
MGWRKAPAHSVKPTKAAMRYSPANKKVKVVSRIPAAVIQQPYNIGFLGPKLLQKLLANPDQYRNEVSRS